MAGAAVPVTLPASFCAFCKTIAELGSVSMRTQCRHHAVDDAAGDAAPRAKHCFHSARSYENLLSKAS